MRTRVERRLVDFVAGLGRNASEVARLTGIPRSTMRGWLREPPLDDRPDCVNNTPEVPKADYAYPLGMYLGDGDISRSSGNRCYRLRITADASYPGVIAECAAAMQAVVPRNRVSIRRRTRGERAVEISAYSEGVAAALSATWARQEAHPPNRPRALARGHRSNSSPDVLAWSVALRRMPCAELRQRDVLPPLLLHPNLAGHPRTFLPNLRRIGNRHNFSAREDCVRGPREERCSARFVRRSEGLRR
jgi:hypothetical protein